jgi:outer membrane lipoprotein carrier protein
MTEFEGRTYTIKLDGKGALQSIAFYDNLDNKVQILFLKMRYSAQTVPSEKMQCNYPAAYDVIRG